MKQSFLKLDGLYLVWSNLIVAFMAAVVIDMMAAAPARAQTMDSPLGIAIAKDNTIYIADRNLPGIWRFRDGKMEEFFKGSKQFKTPLNAVRCVAVDGEGNVYAGDSSTRDIYRFDASNQPVALAGGRIGIPMSIAFNSKGEIFVSDLESKRIVKVPAAGGEPAEFAVVDAPHGIAIDGQDNVWVVSHGKNQLLRIGMDGKMAIVVEGAPFKFPHDVVVGSDGTAYVSDGYSKAIWKIAVGSKPVKLVEGGPLDNPVGLALSKDALYCIDPRARSLFSVSLMGGAIKKMNP
jgi:sugar lactone lactonase YvrE